MSNRMAATALLGLLAVGRLAAGADWFNWRGPDRSGVSEEKGLVSSWSKKTGENLIWRDDFTGRSTPVVLQGRVCANGRAGTGLLRQEVVACWDAGTGKRLWERRFDVYNTTVPFTRVGWAAIAGDPETGYVYAQNVDGQVVCLDKTGKTVWERRARGGVRPWLGLRGTDPHPDRGRGPAGRGRGGRGLGRHRPSPAAVHRLRQAHRSRALDLDAGAGPVRRREQPVEPDRGCDRRGAAGPRRAGPTAGSTPFARARAS